VEDILFVFYYDGMSRVSSALIADYHTRSSRKGVDNASLAFVSPLNTYYHICTALHTLPLFTDIQTDPARISLQ
jgi:hypothetical protein